MAKRVKKVQIVEDAFREEDAVERCDLIYHFLTACDQNNVVQMKQYLSQGVDPNSHKQYENALHRTSKNGYLKATQILLGNCRTKVNFRDDFGSTSLILAAERNKYDVCRMLLRAGANVHLTDKNGYTALHRAIKWRNIKIVALLLKFKASPNAETAFMKTPLRIAAADLYCKEIVSLLIEYGAELNQKNNKTMPLLLECALSCSTLQQLEIIKLLLDNGANIDIQDLITARSALHIVALSGYLPLASLLLGRGANTSLKDRDNFKAIDIARRNQNINIVNLLEENTNPVTEDNNKDDLFSKVESRLMFN